MRPTRFSRARRPAGPGSSRFAGTFARRPLTPRVASLPDRRAWMTTAFVATFVAGAAVAVPLLTHLGGDSPKDTIVAVDAPLTSRATTTPTATPTAVPTATTTVTGKPRVSVATATVTVTAPGGQVTVLKPGATVTLPGATTTVTAPGGQVTVVKPGTTVTLPKATTTVTTKVTEKGQQQTGGNSVKQDSNQLRAMKSTPATLRSDGAKRCIDVKDGRAGAGTDGTPLQVWDCHDDANQAWAFNSDGTVRALNQCMDLAWGSIAENTAIQLVACNGSAAQQFRVTQKGQLINPAAEGKCVTVDKGDNGGRLFLRGCTGDGNQKWVQS
ncbi:ricin-type beta-trefoil lectin domain protein [Kribbella sp. DT2]|uniref:ricin-type beta-trefoil lectin domain protein n=1 Tax=Kribbella sp. DT2 TaxID=3393427 RepID=UPI003CF59D5B